MKENPSKNLNNNINTDIIYSDRKMLYKLSCIFIGNDMNDSKNIKSTKDRQDDRHTGPHTFELDSWFDFSPYEQLLQMEVVEVKDGKAKLTMAFLLQYAQGAGLMHGGAIISFADTALVMAIKSVLPPHTHFATVSVEANFLKPVKQGIITADARLTRQQQRLIDGKVEVHTETGEQVLSFSARFKIARDAQIKQVIYADAQKS
jgi:acyl-CoA thioesterase